MLLRRYRTDEPGPEPGTPDAPQADKAAGRSPSRGKTPKEG